MPERDRQKIRKKDANYVLSLKGNQGNFHDDIALFFRTLENKDQRADCQYHQTLDGEHGRIETREYWTCLLYTSDAADE